MLPFRFLSIAKIHNSYKGFYFRFIQKFQQEFILWRMDISEMPKPRRTVKMHGRTFPCFFKYFKDHSLVKAPEHA